MNLFCATRLHTARPATLRVTFLGRIQTGHAWDVFDITQIADGKHTITFTARIVAAVEGYLTSETVKLHYGTVLVDEF